MICRFISHELELWAYTQPRADFWRYLQRLVEAGCGWRIMFGSDQIVWPDAITVAIDAILTAPFLIPQQKRDILHDDDARFLGGVDKLPNGSTSRLLGRR
jgi:predicted TIM-barrel fold metal-dependent hydrolase